MTSTTIGVVLIEDQDIFRRGVRLILEGTPDIKVVGEAATGEAGVQLFERLSPGQVQVVITDLVLPDISGLDVLRRVKAKQPDVAVLLLTMYADEEHIRGMI